MTCDGTPPLAATGAPVVALLALGLLAVVAGWVLVRTARGRVAAALVPVLLLGALVLPRQPASADPRCALRVDQTSVNVDLRPGAAPQPITGRVTNDAVEATRVAAVTVAVVEVVKAPGAAPGPCDASDYLLLDPRMPVDRELAPGGSVEFSGALIGFADKDTDQDGCQGARVVLRYTTS
ncbi:hypothetical protein [Actinokineospora bangkokensis]|uniref:Uncharacterized protein n=1 Tax=Actinokineospora bangkokensis TaxID=1193682 RepID=A0A1Q9LIY6_9PSEU|nr:hypothetical protein [Actinokineospora bangkokensis]OLR91965.1 hypothetical protein BJP25_24410 [Actinokineospora bangkokensis]